MTTTLLKPALSTTSHPATEAETDILLSLIAKAKARGSRLNAHWQLDEKSHLYCHWEIEP